MKAFNLLDRKQLLEAVHYTNFQPLWAKDNWDKAGKFTATTWVCGDYLILVSTAQHPHYLVQINDKILAHNMREVFKGIWQGLK